MCNRYTDDIQFYISFSSSSCEAGMSELLPEMSWMKVNQLKFNADKNQIL